MTFFQKYYQFLMFQDFLINQAAILSSFCFYFTGLMLYDIHTERKHLTMSDVVFGIGEDVHAASK